MPIDRGVFYAGVRGYLFNGVLDQQQVDGMNDILTEWGAQQEARGYMMKAGLAYMLATVYHETDKKMWPIEEYGKGKGKVYGEIDPASGKAYYGRGFVQLTWKANYIKAGQKLGIDLYSNPEYALELDTATKILFYGMYEGWFTGKKLSDYFNENRVDYINARRIINRLDRAELIAGYAMKFREALEDE